MKFLEYSFFKRNENDVFKTEFFFFKEWMSRNSLFNVNEFKRFFSLSNSFGFNGMWWFVLTWLNGMDKRATMITKTRIGTCSLVDSCKRTDSWTNRNVLFAVSTQAIRTQKRRSVFLFDEHRNKGIEPFNSKDFLDAWRKFSATQLLSIRFFSPVDHLRIVMCTERMTNECKFGHCKFWSHWKSCSSCNIAIEFDSVCDNNLSSARHWRRHCSGHWTKENMVKSQKLR